MSTAARWCVGSLAQERSNCRFNKEEITNFFDGGADKTEARRQLEEIVLSDPAFEDPIPPEYLSHEQMYENELRKSIHLLHIFNTDERLAKIAPNGIKGMMYFYDRGLSTAIHKDGNPMSIHFAMFLPAIMGQGNPEQQKEWLDLATAGSIIGTYAQTELGHGTYLRGLETTATYDPVTEEFVINSPTITATKWWPGGLGKTSSYTVVVALLYTEGRCHGPHLFMVQVRDTNTHQSLPGVTLGDIGPRFGFKSNDNGFLRFNQFRIPRGNMFMKHAQVLKDGTYVKPLSSKLSYGSMTYVRVGICFGSTRGLMVAVTIATRYAAVRHQSELVADDPEVKIMEYQTQQFKILPQIATVFAQWFAAHAVRQTYATVQDEIDQGNLNLLPELHAVSCGLKALSSSDSLRGIDILRLGCGGHGFSDSTNLPRIYCTTAAACTYEGENTVLWLQVARYLIKCFRESQRGGRLQKSVSYLEYKQIPAKHDLSNQGLLSAFKCSLQLLVLRAAEQLQRRCDKGEPYEVARNHCSQNLVNCAQLHMRHYVCDQFVPAVEEFKCTEPVRDVLQRLCRLYLINTVISNHGFFIR
ncbi:unnamed protein product, partial [Meganyctiphanes norvegica]